jgi:hypothetical protein
MPKFRTKTREIEAEQFIEGKLPLPFSGHHPPACCLGSNGWYVTTIHGHATPIADGDWIVPEPDGEHFYPIKPEVFEANYEAD